MTSKYIHQAACRLKSRYREDDPEALAEDMGFLVLYMNMGRGEKCCKGFFIRQSRVTAIVVNGDLPRYIRTLVIAHELGHAVLHSEQLENGLIGDACVFDSGSLFEREADIFAAELLIRDSQTLELLREGTTIREAAHELGVPEELLDYKLLSLKSRRRVVCAPEPVKSGYLRRIN